MQKKLENDILSMLSQYSAQRCVLPVSFPVDLLLWLFGRETNCKKKQIKTQKVEILCFEPPPQKDYQRFTRNLLRPNCFVNSHLISDFIFQSQESMNTQLENKTELPTICSKRFVKNLINQGNGNNSAHLNLAKEYIHKVVSCFISLDSS